MVLPANDGAEVLSQCGLGRGQALGAGRGDALPVADAIERTVDALCELQRQRSIAFSVEVGRVVVERIYGDIDQLRLRHGKPHPSLRGHPGRWADEVGRIVAGEGGIIYRAGRASVPHAFAGGWCGRVASSGGMIVGAQG